MQKKVRIIDIAKMAGVSKGTVDRVLHNRGNVSEKARTAINRVLDEVNYKPNIHVSAISLKRSYKIVVTTPEVSPGAYWESIHNGIHHALEEYENIKIELLVFTYNQYDIFSCRQIFEKIASLKMDALIIGPTFAEETINLCKKMDDRDVPYIFVDSNIESTMPLAFLSADHYVCGYMIAKLITSIIRPETNIAIFQAVRRGDISSNTTILRKKGFTDYLEKNKCTNLVLSIPFSVTEPESNEMYLSRLFRSQKEVPAIVVLNSRGNFIADYLEANHIEGVKMICMDLTSANIEALKKGQIDYLIGQEPEYQGFFAMKTMLEYLIFKKKITKENYVQLDIITQENIDFYKRFNNIMY
ncbi:MAG: LacI family DNA-binding transcriptional regulator [Proteiniphilum sp.]|jgi:LacI family transcriptional regulator|nr:LacI family DNA-binding transcriptional regulator [Proteiniphilum sp.]